MLLCGGTLAVLVLGAAASTTPPWDYKPDHTSKCIQYDDESRWLTYALPSGTPPAGGWPIYLSLITDLFDGDNVQTCGEITPGSTRKNYTAFATPAESMATCQLSPSPLAFGITAEDEANANAAVAVAGVDDACDDAMAAQCTSSAKGGLFTCMHCAKEGPESKGTCSSMAGYQWCQKHSGGGHPPHPGEGGCMYDQEAGTMWDQRLKQYLVANGIAVFNLNPYEEDQWDNYASAWKSGKDRAFLPQFFKQVGSGAFGPIDVSKTVVRGWSGGAQMVSWMIQVMAEQPGVFPGVTMAAGVMLSGGSYACYNDPQDPQYPLQPVGSCQGCVEGGPGHCQGDPKCDSCNAAVKPYCGQCCPTNYTEAHFAATPSDYSKHPPIFLSQTSTVDNHADLCACKNYYETLQANNVKSEIVYVDSEDQNCFCIGTPNNTAAAGSPFSQHCDASWGSDCSTMGGPNCCITHTMGNANMLLPAVAFIQDAVGDTKGAQATRATI